MCLRKYYMKNGQDGRVERPWAHSFSQAHKTTTNHRTIIDEKTGTYQKRFPTAKDIKEKLHWDGSEGQIHNNQIPYPAGG